MDCVDEVDLLRFPFLMIFLVIEKLLDACNLKSPYAQEALTSPGLLKGMSDRNTCILPSCPVIKQERPEDAEPAGAYLSIDRHDNVPQVAVIFIS